MRYGFKRLRRGTEAEVEGKRLPDPGWQCPETARSSINGAADPFGLEEPRNAPERRPALMPEERIRRRLAAILAADVVGYSRLMERNEAATLADLKARHETV